jgi:hypothetical protein
MLTLIGAGLAKYDIDQSESPIRRATLSVLLVTGETVDGGYREQPADRQPEEINLMHKVFVNTALEI